MVNFYQMPNISNQLSGNTRSDLQAQLKTAQIQHALQTDRIIESSTSRVKNLKKDVFEFKIGKMEIDV